MKQGDPEKIRKNWKRMLNRLNGDKDDTEKIIYFILSDKTFIFITCSCGLLCNNGIYEWI